MDYRTAHVFLTVALMAFSALMSYNFTRVAYDKTLTKEERETHLIRFMKLLWVAVLLSQFVGLAVFPEKYYKQEFNKRYHGELWITAPADEVNP